MTWALRKKRLESLGLTYKEYLQSDHWVEMRKKYRASGMPQKCVVCGDSHVDLHHISYARLGKELLADLMPLCPTHHRAVHDCERMHPTQLESIGKLFRLAFGWGKAKVRDRMEPFNWNGVRHVDDMASLTKKQKLRHKRKAKPAAAPGPPRFNAPADKAWAHAADLFAGAGLSRNEADPEAAQKLANALLMRGLAREAMKVQDYVDAAGGGRQSYATVGWNSRPSRAANNQPASK